MKKNGSLNGDGHRIARASNLALTIPKYGIDLNLEDWAFVEGYRGRSPSGGIHSSWSRRHILAYFDGLVEGRTDKSGAAIARKALVNLLDIAESYEADDVFDACHKYRNRVVSDRLDAIRANKWDQREIAKWFKVGDIIWDNRRSILPADHSAVIVEFVPSRAEFYLDDSFWGGMGNRPGHICGPCDVPWWYRKQE